MDVIVYDVGTQAAAWQEEDAGRALHNLPARIQPKRLVLR
jgi:hypothetical protein